MTDEEIEEAVFAAIDECRRYVGAGWPLVLPNKVVGIVRRAQAEALRDAAARSPFGGDVGDFLEDEAERYDSAGDESRP